MQPRAGHAFFERFQDDKKNVYFWAGSVEAALILRELKMTPLEKRSRRVDGELSSDFITVQVHADSAEFVWAIQVNLQQISTSDYRGIT